MRGTRNLDEGEQVVEDPVMARVLRRRAWNLYIMSAAVAAVLTVSFWLLPVAEYGAP